MQISKGLADYTPHVCRLPTESSRKNNARIFLSTSEVRSVQLMPRKKTSLTHCHTQRNWNIRSHKPAITSSPCTFVYSQQKRCKSAGTWPSLTKSGIDLFDRRSIGISTQGGQGRIDVPVVPVSIFLFFLLPMRGFNKNTINNIKWAG